MSQRRVNATTYVPLSYNYVPKKGEKPGNVEKRS